MSNLKTVSITPALRNIARIREAREAAQAAVQDRTDTICRALDAIDSGKPLGEALEIAFNAGYVTGHLEATAETVAPSYAMLAAVLDRQAARR